MTENLPPNSPTLFDRLNQFIQESITIKLLLVGLLILILLIPLAMIEDLISERTMRMNEATAEIAQSWAGGQVIGGPVLNIPFTDFHADTRTTTEGTLHVFPEKLNVVSDVQPEIRYRGIFEVPVYQSETTLDFAFSSAGIQQYSNRTYHWDRASMSVGITDPRGITEPINVDFNGHSSEFEPGLPTTNVFQSGVTTDIDFSDSASSMEGKMTIHLRGTNTLHFVPVGKTTSVEMSSTWANPSFEGNFLPTDREISASGFTASWNVLHYNRGFQQVFSEQQYLEGEDFGVNLFLPVNHYQKSERSAKYGVLLIALTFILFFFSQVINKIRIHPFQYFLVGLALCLFYTLLLSLSEHTGFDIAYAIAALMILVMITLYIKQIYRSVKFTAITSAVLAGLYIYIFCLLQMQDYALLIGSIGLFIILSLIMWLSLKIDWTGKRLNGA